MDYFDGWIIHYKRMIANAESRIVYYKRLMTDIHKRDELKVDWFKEFVRDTLNHEQRRLKEMLDEYYWYKNYIEPPYNVGRTI